MYQLSITSHFSENVDTVGRKGPTPALSHVGMLIYFHALERNQPAEPQSTGAAQTVATRGVTQKQT